MCVSPNLLLAVLCRGCITVLFGKVEDRKNRDLLKMATVFIGQVHQGYFYILSIRQHDVRQLRVQNQGEVDYCRFAIVNLKARLISRANALAMNMVAECRPSKVQKIYLTIERMVAVSYLPPLPMYAAQFCYSLIFKSGLCSSLTLRSRVHKSFIC